MLHKTRAVEIPSFCSLFTKLSKSELFSKKVLTNIAVCDIMLVSSGRGERRIDMKYTEILELAKIGACSLFKYYMGKTTEMKKTTETDYDAVKNVYRELYQEYSDKIDEIDKEIEIQNKMEEMRNEGMGD